jgi:hypothetical protein
VLSGGSQTRVRQPGRIQFIFILRSFASFCGTESSRFSILMATPALSLDAGKIFEFLLGKSTAPTQISSTDLVKRQHDPFAKLVLGQGHLPLTLRELLKIVDAVAGPDSLPDQISFLVADGGQIPWTVATEDIDRAMRFVVTRGVKGQSPVLLVSTSTDFGSSDTFLQVIGWDSINGAFQFYERRSGSWVWAGGIAPFPKKMGKNEEVIVRSVIISSV